LTIKASVGEGISKATQDLDIWAWAVTILLGHGIMSGNTSEEILLGMLLLLGSLKTDG
jgi:hypothetical protein